MELLIVIGIIVLLAGLGIAAMPGVRKQMTKSATKTFMKSLEMGLVKYKQEYGNYPINEPSSDDDEQRDADGKLGAAILYLELSGDIDGDGEFDDADEDNGGVVFVKGLTGEMNEENATVQRSRRLGDDYLLIDPFSNPIRYLAHKPNAKNKLTRNPTYDLWSIGDSRNGDYTPQGIANWIGNFSQ